MMKKRIFSLLLALVLCLSLVSVANAGSASKSGQTRNGATTGIPTHAQLSVTSSRANATTGVTGNSQVALTTSVTLYFVNQWGDASTRSAGNARAVAAIESGTGYAAYSEHTVDAGSKYGTWSCSLSANA